MKKLSLAVVCTSLLAAGCASTDPVARTDPAERAVMREDQTGTHFKRRDPVNPTTSYDREAIERARNSTGYPVDGPPKN